MKKKKPIFEDSVRTNVNLQFKVPETKLSFEGIFPFFFWKNRIQKTDWRSLNQKKKQKREKTRKKKEKEKKKILGAFTRSMKNG